MGLSIAKNRENFEFLVKIFPKGQIPRAIFYTKLRMGRVSRVRTLTPNFTVLTLQMWAYTAKNC